MKAKIEVLARQMESVGETTSIEAEPARLSRYAIFDKTPALLFRPRDVDQLSAALRLCYEAEAAVIPWGAGTAMGLGNAPRRADVVMVLQSLARLLEHDHANLSATVGAGVNLATVHKLTAEHRQFVPFDPPFFQHATIGGTVAANLNGPRRLFYGSVRDRVLGLKVALCDGEQIKAGGKVVKNVAGYDMCKLFVGSLGTLGIVTEVTLKLAPLPEDTAVLLASGTLANTLRLCRELSTSPLLPSAVVLFNRETGHELGNWVVAARTEGFVENVKRHLDDFKEAASRDNLDIMVLQGPACDKLWNWICDFPLADDRWVYRLVQPIACLDQLERTWEELRDLETPGLLADAHTGTLWLSFSAQASSSAALTTVQSLARERAGHAMLFSAPTKSKAVVEDVWGVLPPAFPLMAKVKRQFDPRDLLNPGRFLGRL